jgi:site-specific DNA-methyltransferase (adenine-specific)
MAWTSFDTTAKIFRFSNRGFMTPEQQERIHPTQKPIALYAWLLTHYANPGDRIFDPMMGSQSSRIAAYQMGFDYAGCELNKEYFDSGCERFNRECRGETKTKDGHVVTQLQLFDM